ncbi:MAG: glycosyltransferase [Muribaculaceae bacterium]|nr:glycosyltransferase [Muribaculaceae bacterium]
MQRTRDITVSVIIPVYNVGRYLPKCLESIARQSFGNFEVIVVDDGSTDDSGSIADDFAKLDSRFRVIHQKNLGLSAARNVGLDEARGEHITFVDGDDWIHPQLYEWLLSTLIKTGADIAMCDFVKTDNSNMPISDYNEIPLPNVNDGYAATKSLIENKKPSYSVVWNKLYNRDLIGGHRFLNTTSEDSMFNMAIYMKASVVSHLPLPLVYYRQREDSITHNNNAAYYIDKVDSAFQSYDSVLRNHCNELEKLFLWRWFRYALNRLEMAQGTEFESYAQQKVSSIMGEYWSDAKRLLPWHKSALLKTMWKHQRINSLVLSLNKRLKNIRH